MFQFAGQLYKSVCLPNCLTPALRLFTKILKPVFAVLHKEGHDIMAYLDDSILFGDNYDEYKAAVLIAVNLFQNFGFQVYPEKSSVTPNGCPNCPNGWGIVHHNISSDNWSVEKNCILICWNYLLLIMYYKFTKKICLILQSI